MLTYMGRQEFLKKQDIVEVYARMLMKLDSWILKCQPQMTINMKNKPQASDILRNASLLKTTANTSSCPSCLPPFHAVRATAQLWVRILFHVEQMLVIQEQVDMFHYPRSASLCSFCCQNNKADKKNGEFWPVTSLQ